MGTALVIGVGSENGVGGALCRRFAREGMHVVVAGRTEEKVASVAESLREAGGQATHAVGDATDAAGVAHFFDVAGEIEGPPELVVYNVGNNRFAPLLEMTDEFFEDLWRICCFGGFLTGREAARRMIPAGGGTLLFTGATASVRARPPFTAFASAKEKGLYDKVLVFNGNQGRHYALSNPKEYFAESTEAYFGVNDFYPFVRAELREHDPKMFALMEKFWGKVP